MNRSASGFDAERKWGIRKHDALESRSLTGDTNGIKMESSIYGAGKGLPISKQLEGHNSSMKQEPRH